MALGVDLYAAEIVLNLKAKYPHITLESAIPCETQAVKWSVAARERYYNIAAKCDKETMLQREYTSDCKAFWNHRHCRWFSLYNKIPHTLVCGILVREAGLEPLPSRNGT